MAGAIAPRTRMARVVVTVAEPFTRQTGKINLLNSLLPGMFVDVQLQGAVLDNVIAVPRAAMHDNDSVWIVDNDNKLHHRTLEIVRRERDEVLVRSGVDAGEMIVLTNLSGAAEGMLLRPQLREVAQ